MSYTHTHTPHNDREIGEGRGTEALFFPFLLSLFCQVWLQMNSYMALYGHQALS